MAQRKIVWTKKANIERKEILEYWIYKNKSARFSKKLNLLFVESLSKSVFIQISVEKLVMKKQKLSLLETI